MKTKILFLYLVMVFLTISGFSQDVVKPNEAKKITLEPEQTKTLRLNLKKDDFAGVEISANESSNFSYKIFAPSGKNLLDYAVSFENAFSFVASEDGEYKIEITPHKSEDVPAAREVTVKYKNKFVLPAKSVLKATRKVNGYEAKIYEVDNEDGDAYLLIEKGGKLKFISKGSKIATGLHFADTAEKDDATGIKSSANLFRATADKTGDGTPDIAVEYYSGGAHCCFSLYFYELGNEIKPIKSLDTGDAQTIAVGKMPDGSLKLSTGDNTFAYWNTSFAESPIPEVILTFRDGEFRPDAKLMQKPAPNLVKLKQEAATVRRKMPPDTYIAEKGASFGDIFWSKMLDLIYSGHEDLAWQYFDLAWNPKKKGKELFKQDFKNQLSNSKFYRMYLESK
ncbi:MAG: emp24/gp25L/p24 family protein [Acidobacteriota bacterium]|nr:emp24/gp25L/p24 family protein [Acidobacteriota bacterium]